jgi:prevent-host-death family protein
MKTYTYSEARQHLAEVLDEASRSGEVRISRRDGRSFAIRPARTKRSPLDVAGIESDVSGQEIVAMVREMRRRPR